MSKFFHLVRVNRLKHQLEKQPTVLKLFKNIKLINTILIVSIIFIGICYLVVLNLTATKGFETKILNERITSLNESNRKLELQITQLRSLSYIQEESQELNLESVTQVEYLTPPAATVALAE